MTTTNAPALTRSAEAERLADLGVPEGPCRETLLRAGAPARHAARVVATGRAFASHYDEWWAVALALDLIGVGGPLGLAGLSTARVAGASGLGKGRWQASDGEAYRAAARKALGGLTLTPESVAGAFEAHWALAPWVVAAATRAVGEAAGVVEPRPDLSVTFAGEISHWATLADRAREAVARDARAAAFTQSWLGAGLPAPETGTDSQTWVPIDVIDGHNVFREDTE